jgi:phosphate transport system substrate-binding protein
MTGTTLPSDSGKTKRRWRSVRGLARIAVAAVVTNMFACPPSFAGTETLRVGGTGAAEAILLRLGVIFEAQHGTRIKVLPYLGSDGGIRALMDGVIDLAVIARPLTQAEASNGLKIALSGYTPFVLVTSWPNSVNLRSADLAKLYTAVDPRWSDGAPIRIILRPQFDSETTLMARFFPELGDALATARRRPDIAIAGSDDDNADLAVDTYGSLTASTYLQVASEQRPLKFISIDGREPSLAGVESGTYPYRKQLDIVIRNKGSDEVARLISFLRSAQARNLMRDAGLALTE